MNNTKRVSDAAERLKRVNDQTSLDANARAEKMPQVGEQTECFNALLDEQDKLLTALEGKLANVTVQSVKEVSSDKLTENDLVPLASALRTMNAKLGYHNAWIKGLIGRIEV